MIKFMPPRERAQWIYVSRELLSRFPWHAWVGGIVVARCTTKREATGIIRRIRAALTKSVAGGGK